MEALDGLFPVIILNCYSTFPEKIIHPLGYEDKNTEFHFLKYYYGNSN